MILNYLSQWGFRLLWLQCFRNHCWQMQCVITSFRGGCDQPNRVHWNERLRKAWFLGNSAKVWCV